MPEIGPITLSHTSFADLDLLLAEDAAEREDAWPGAATDGPEGLEPETIDAFNTQILAGPASPRRARAHARAGARETRRRGRLPGDRARHYGRPLGLTPCPSNARTGPN